MAALPSISLRNSRTATGINPAFLSKGINLHVANASIDALDYSCSIRSFLVKAVTYFSSTAEALQTAGE